MSKSKERSFHVFQVISDLLLGRPVGPAGQREDRAATWQAFDSDPDGFLAPYGLTQDEKVLLYTCSRPLILERLKRDLWAWNPMAENHTFWPGPEPQVATVAPLSAAHGTTVELTITGQGILRGAKVILFLQREGEDSFDPTVVEGRPSLEPASATFSGTFERTIIKAVLSIPKDAPHVRDYWVTVWNGDNVLYSESRDPWPPRGDNPDSRGLPPLVAKNRFRVT